jgi:hypothetical protein
MVPIPESLRLDLYEKYTMPYTLSLKSLNKSLWNFMWDIAHVSRSHSSFQGAYEVLNKYSVTHILQWED